MYASGSKVSGGNTYVDRGDFGAYDFDNTDFTADSQWHDLDLSAIIPANAVVVFFSVYMKNPSQQASIIFRKKGYVNELNIARQYTPDVDESIVGNFFVPVGSDGIIEYKTTNINWAFLHLAIRGWLT